VADQTINHSATKQKNLLAAEEERRERLWYFSLKWDFEWMPPNVSHYIGLDSQPNRMAKEDVRSFTSII
jgi:hypothetical protein